MSVRLSRPSLRRLLSVLFFLLAALPAGAIGVRLTNSMWERELQRVHEQHLQLARYLAQALARYAEDAEAAFHLAISNLIDGQPVKDLDVLLDRMHFKHVCIVTEEGVVQQGVMPKPMKIENMSPQLIRKLRIVSNGLEHSTLYSGILPDRGGDPTIYLWRPLHANRYAIGALKTDYFVRLQSVIRFGRKGHAAIVDHHGQIIAHPQAQWRTAMRSLSHLDPVYRMMAGETGVSRFFSPAVQEEMIAGFTTVPKTAWGVMIPQPLSELRAHVRGVKVAVWSVIGLALMGAAILGGIVSRLLASPLRRIGLVAEQFAKRSYEARVRNLGMFATREVASLATQFNAMADEVKRGWNAQHESEQRFRAFAEIAADWFWETDMQQVFTYVSPSAEAGRPWDAALLLGHHRREHLMGEREGEVIRRIQTCMDRHEAFDGIVYRIRGSDGQPLHLSVAGRPVYDVSGQVMGYRGVAHDITERLLTQARLRLAQEEEQQRHARKMEAIGTLAGGIAHDFNNILTAILGFTELTLVELPVGSNAQRRLREVYAAGKRAKDLVQQILTFSRKDEPVRRPLQLHPVVHEALKLLRASLPATIAILPEVAEDTPPVLADSTQMHQVLMNLCANAEYAMRESGGILKVVLSTVEVDDGLTARHPSLRPGPYVRIRVQDTGPGIAAEILERIFEPFFTTKGVGEGSGMGLAVVHGIVTSHHGVITAQSGLGQGATFDVYLPPVNDQVDEAVTGDNASPRKQGAGTILFVEDEVTIASWGQEVLQNFGYRVVVKTDARQALEAFLENPQAFDLVITDQTMPHMTGEALIRELRRLRPDLPAILCTGFSHTMDADKAQAQGINAFLMKPVLADDLGQIVQRILAHRP